MKSEKIAQKERYTRGAAPKVSLVLTGIETFGLLIMGLLVLVAGRMLGANANASDTSDDLAALFAEGVGALASAMFMIIAVILLIFGVWALIFWLVCVKSKNRRRRDVVCTVVGRLPGIALFIMTIAMGMFGIIAILLLIWLFLSILLSAVGWKEA